MENNQSTSVQGRCVREVEQQMAALRSENFNLKLRMYLMEESIPGYQRICSTPDGPGTLMKELIDRKVEIEILRKEIEEKQELLQDAARAINHIENLLKDTEIKHEEELDDLRQKLDFYETKHEMEKTQSTTEDLLQRSDVVENLNALQRIRELEELLKRSDEKLVVFQTQISTLDEMLTKRDKTIIEYEEKVKELAFQNSELLESEEIKDKDAANNELCIRRLRSTNAQLKVDNEMLIRQMSQVHFNKEIGCFKTYERKMRDQQEVLTEMQSTMSMKTANTARLLERLQDYEEKVTKLNMERKMAKRENQFFRVIIEKLQSNCNQCYTFEKEEVYQNKNSMPLMPDYCETLTDLPGKLNMCEADLLQSSKFRHNFQEDYKFKQKLKVNFCSSLSCCKEIHQCQAGSADYKGSNVKFVLPPNTLSLSLPREKPSIQRAYLCQNSEMDASPPVRYSISGPRIFCNDHILKPSSSGFSLMPDISPSSCSVCKNLRSNCMACRVDTDGRF